MIAKRDERSSRISSVPWKEFVDRCRGCHWNGIITGVLCNYTASSLDIHARPLCFAGWAPLEEYLTTKGNRCYCSQYASRPRKQSPHTYSHLPILSLSMLEPDNPNCTTILLSKIAPDEVWIRSPKWSIPMLTRVGMGSKVTFQTRWFRIKRAREPRRLGNAVCRPSPTTTGG